MCGASTCVDLWADTDFSECRQLPFCRPQVLSCLDISPCSISNLPSFCVSASSYTQSRSKSWGHLLFLRKRRYFRWKSNATFSTEQYSAKSLFFCTFAKKALKSCTPYFTLFKENIILLLLMENSHRFYDTYIKCPGLHMRQSFWSLRLLLGPRCYVHSH